MGLPGRRTESNELGKPKQEMNTDALPIAVTFFLTVSQRRLLLQSLKAYSDQRSRAILIALGLIEKE